ncbi:energy-coupling factor transport system permease protein [Herbinix hemicellulosilytica]|uniref:Putative membrane protein n=1 Tax=Herbinix hemicellulosilytica TaxID=1564487 RepID=A0A0H5SIX4_HERHM|nr:energy-coupling factor transporter transmembrane component T [Herbinix hemicellulosilytica]RBP58520.1 energy-coupling factor transport system permease protein [Herbinix hemicellulosilytica]CRZ35015.1 putative membrane protein [Herbinix hemicellulosilytica]
MIQERYKPTFLRKLYPNTKLWMSLGISCAVIFFNNIWFSLAVMILSLIMIAYEKYILEFKVVSISIIIMAVMMFAINGTLNPVNNYTNDPVFILPLLNWKFYKEGLEYALTYFGRIAPLMCALFLLFRTMNMTDLGIGMYEGGIPYNISFMFISTFQTIPILGKDMNQIMDAQRARGLDTEGNLIKRFKAFLPVMVPVVANSIMRVRNQAVALETKGFNSSAKKTVYRDLPKTKADHILKWSSILLSIGSIVYRIIQSFF